MTEAAPGEEPLLRVENLSLGIGRTAILSQVALAIDSGESVGLIGESGSGKSMLAKTLLGLQPRQARISGHVTFAGEPLLGLSEMGYRQVRGLRIGYVPQDPATAYNPTLRVGRQINEPNEFHPARGTEKRQTPAEMLESVCIDAPARRARQYPHELSGGMLQRGLIASAVSLSPSLLIADEPTTALDVTTQAGIIELLRDIQRRTGMALLLISHDLALVSAICGRIAVLYRGSVVEEGRVEQIIDAPAHPYTRSLLAATPLLHDIVASPVAGIHAGGSRHG